MAAARTQATQPPISLPAPKYDAGEKKEARPSPFAFLSRSKPAAEPDTPAAPAGTALIRLAIAPWGEVYVDGDRIGVSPPVNEVEVAPGKRKIEIKNGSFPAYVQVVDLKADQKIRIKHKFN
jgi:serine/threonine-protein kinase